MAGWEGGEAAKLKSSHGVSFAEMLSSAGLGIHYWVRSPSLELRTILKYGGDGGDYMHHTETDYLIIGAGASGMAFADTLLSETDCEMVIVDRRAHPGGHWVDAYSFVQLHQPSAYYGVNSLSLGEDRIDDSGINKGFYERAGAAEIQHYNQRVVADIFLPSKRVSLHFVSDYLGCEDGAHILRSKLTGQLTRIVARRALVDATVMQSSVPARHTRSYTVAEDVAVLTPNELVNAADAKGFTVFGAGKTSMDVCFWLLQQGVDPNKITWIRPRDVWMGDRASTQPFELAGNMMRAGARSMKAAAEAIDANDYALRMEADGMMHRVDTEHFAPVNRGAVISQPELEALRSIERIVRLGYVRAVSQTKVILEHGELRLNPDQIFVDCTAAGLNNASPKPVFEADKINLLFTTRGVGPWSAALVGFVESLNLPVEEKNRLCPPMQRTGDMAGVLNIMRLGMLVEPIRRSVSELAEWSAKARLNPGRSIPTAMSNPEVQADFGVFMQYQQAALENLERLCAETETA